ncbi:UNVERIFIED_CONTAM: hypothetical protein Scaly_0590900 [Sesamum calycinum]|uniref:Uncharacterized protein n=1 Tax=Sesamum calycinum TaxID=2727403 RepID=A0AAW2RUE0_9LAMI
MDMFNCTRATHTPKSLSDHYHLLILAQNSHRRPSSSFRFQNTWLHHHTFLETMKKNWEAPIRRYGMYKIQEKLYRAKEILKEWTKQSFGNVFTTVDEAKHATSEAKRPLTEILLMPPHFTQQVQCNTCSSSPL